jgi:hypothetical protein
MSEPKMTAVLNSASEHDSFVDLGENVKIKNTMGRIRVSDDDSKDNTAVLEIINYPKFNGIKYSYSNVGVGEEESDGSLSLQFEYNIESTPANMDIETFSENDMEEFHTFLGDVIMAMVLTKTQGSNE